MRASPHFSYPFCCDWLRPVPASFRSGFPLDSMFSYSPAGNPGRALRERVLSASRDEGYEKCGLVILGVGG